MGTNGKTSVEGDGRVIITATFEELLKWGMVGGRDVLAVRCLIWVTLGPW